MRKQIRHLLMLALPMLLGLASCAEHDSPAGNPNPLAKQVSGLWWTMLDSEGTLPESFSGQEYSRIGMAYGLKEDGTGYGVTFFFNNNSSNPIYVIGGEELTKMTYTTTRDGQIIADFGQAYHEYADYYKQFTVTYADGVVTATNGQRTFTLEHPSDEMAAVIHQWDYGWNGGAMMEDEVFNPNDADFTLEGWRDQTGIYIYNGGNRKIEHNGVPYGFTLVPLPWYTGTKQTNLPNDFCDDLTPKNGWELVMNQCGNTSMLNNNFFAIYNKWLGILRIFYYMPELNQVGNDHVWEVTMSDNLAQHSNYGYGVPTDRSIRNKAAIGQTASGAYVDYIAPWVATLSPDGLIVPNQGWWAFDVDLSTYRPNDNISKDYIRLQMRSWNTTHTSLYSTIAADINGTLKADLKLDQQSNQSKKSSSAGQGIMMGLAAVAQAGSAIASFYTGDWANGLTSMGYLFGTGASLAGLGSEGGSSPASFKGTLDGTISLGLGGNIDTQGLMQGAVATTGVASPTIPMSQFNLEGTHMGQGVWNLKTAPKVYRMDYVAFIKENMANKWHYFCSQPYFFDPSSIEVELNPDVFPGSEIEWMEVDAICGATKDKQYVTAVPFNITGNSALRDAYGAITPALRPYWADLIGTAMLEETQEGCLWDFLYNMSDKHGMEALHTVYDDPHRHMFGVLGGSDGSKIITFYNKIQGRGKDGFAIEPQVRGLNNDNWSLYTFLPFLEVNVKVKVKMRGMENPIVLSRNYLPDIVDYGDGYDFESSRSYYFVGKKYGHTDLYDYQMKRIDDIIKLYRTPKVGDLYYSDGTYSKTLEPGKTPIGVVAYVSTPGDDEEIVETDHGGGHGLVLCLKNAANRVKWSTEKVTKFSGQWVTDVAGLKRLNNVSGYSYTATMAANADRYPAAAAAKNYTGLPAPAGTTGWFLPSAQQWVKMMEGLGGMDESDLAWRNHFGYRDGAVDKWENALKKAGSGKYDSMNDGNYTFWSSTECSAEEALMLDILVTEPPRSFMFMPSTKGTAYGNTRVRPILAF